MRIERETTTMTKRGILFYLQQRKYSTRGQLTNFHLPRCFILIYILFTFAINCISVTHRMSNFFCIHMPKKKRVGLSRAYGIQYLILCWINTYSSRNYIIGSQQLILVCCQPQGMNELPQSRCVNCTVQMCGHMQWMNRQIPMNTLQGAIIVCLFCIIELN